MADQQKRGAYATVLYDNNTYGVIPIKWMFKENDKLFCYWCESTKRIAELADANPNWPIYEISKVYGRRG